MGLVFAVIGTIFDSILINWLSSTNLNADDFNKNPWLAVLLMAHAPAVIIYTMIFGKPGRSRSNTAFLCCAFIQWFIIGIAVGLGAALIRKSRRRGGSDQ
jgi:hypothetical protein